MKVLVAVALFACVALQLCQCSSVLFETKYNSEALADVLSDKQLRLETKKEMSHGAPAPEEEKKVEAAPAASAAPTPAEATEAAAADVKAAPPSDAAAPPAAAVAASGSQAAPAAPAVAETKAPAEEKKA